VNNNHAAISLVGGGAWQRVNYQQTILPSTTQDVGAALIGSDVKLYSFNRTTLTSSAHLLPFLSQPGRVQFNLNTAYYVKLWGNFTWNISLYGNWDNRPPPGFSGSDYGASSGINWKFGNQ
jgi:Protein of unknown function, DUF481